MMISTHSIFTIQTSKDNEESIVQIETVITNGLYRFTLLGMQTKHASDTKDRVYSALRSSNLLNLKSDNRKIIVNLSPDDTDKREGLYDLGIALSLLSCLDKKIPEIRILALGGLSITGKIISTKRLKQGIYAAYKNNIQYIVCSEVEEHMILDDDMERLKKFNIRIITAQTLRDLVEKLKSIEQNTIPRKVSEAKKVNEPHEIHFESLNPLSRALLISLSGGHHMLIQTALFKDIKDSCEEISRMSITNGFGHDIYTAYKEKLLDQERISQNTFIENIKLAGKETINSYQKPYLNSVLALYTPCSCGYQYNFFDSNSAERRCICTKRTILQHRRYIETVYFELFDMHITNTDLEPTISLDLMKSIEVVRQMQFERYCNENNLHNKDIFFFPDNSFINQYRDICRIEHILDPDAREVWLKEKYNPMILRIAQTIQDCMTTKKPTLSKQALVLALSYIPRMDF